MEVWTYSAVENGEKYDFTLCDDCTAKHEIIEKRLQRNVACEDCGFHPNDADVPEGMTCAECGETATFQSEEAYLCKLHYQEL